MARRATLVLAAGAAAVGGAAPAAVTVYVTDDGGGARSATYRKTLDPAGTAQGTYADGSASRSNFGSLSIATNPAAGDGDQMFALGFAEGVLTAQQIADEAANLKYPVLQHYGHLPSPEPSAELTAWLERNERWVRGQVREHAATDAWWRAEGLILAQWDGLLAGATAASGGGVTRWDLQLLNGVGDFFDLIPATTPSARLNFSALEDSALRRYIFDAGRCSGLFKVPGDFTNVLFSHASWWSYGSMIRMMKHYRTPLADPAVRSRTVSFSSYPGMLESLDDFYMMGDSGLAMVQTTNGFYNQSLYDEGNNTAADASVLAWQRVRIASMLAGDGASWHRHAARLNSGTYENQYMIFDFKLFTPGAPMPAYTFTVGEQTPGLYEWTDETETLARGYWPSYNVAYHPATYERSGVPGVVDRLGPGHSYQLAPRAKIFRRDQAGVRDLDGLKRIMRYNDFKNDPYSEGDPDNAICSRGDLRSAAQGGPTPGGCLDTKVSQFADGYFRAMRSDVVNGPTSTASSLGPGQPPFAWDEFPNGANFSHAGQPAVFNFTWDTIEPAWPSFAR